MAHQAEYTQFVDEVPTDSLQVAWKAAQGTIPDKSTVGLACLNVASYAMSLTLGQPGEPHNIFMATGPCDPNDTEAVNAAFMAALAPQSAGVQAGAVPWALLLQVALKILKELLA